MKKFIGTKSFYKMVIMIALPIVLQQLVTGLVNLIDNVMVGQLGDAVAGGVGGASKFFFIATLMIFGVTGAAGIFISQYFGANKIEKCRDVFRISIFISIIVCLFAMLLIWIFPIQILNLFEIKDPKMVVAALDYIKYAKYTLIPLGLSLSMMSSLRSVGENKISLYLGVSAVLINTFLNWVLIYGHLGFEPMGAQGAALATLIARIIEMLAYFVIISKHYTIFTFEKATRYRLDQSLLIKVVKKAIPMTANEVFWATGMTMIFASYARTATSSITALTAVDAINNIVFIVFAGMSATISIIVGKNLGANKLEEARSNAIKLTAFGAAFSFMLSIIVASFAIYLPNLYNYSDEVNHYIIYFMWIKCCFFPIYSINTGIFFTLRAGGDATSTLLMDALFTWVFPVLFSTVISINGWLNVIMLMIVVELFDIVKMLLAVYFFKKGKWIKNLTHTHKEIV